MESQILEVADFEEAIEICHRNGWTDGLPVIPPTPERVERFIDAAGRRADEEIGYYALRNQSVTVEKVAINAVMAGCLPEHLPVVIAIVECMLVPEFNIHVANSSTGNLALGFVVNGPIRHQLGMNSQGNVIGPGNRANASIGRALRLVQINVMGSVAGAGTTPDHGRPVLDRSTIGNPAKYASYHIAENEEVYPQLLPLHVMRGFDRQDSVVTAFNAYGHVMLSTHEEKTPEQWIETVAHYLVGAGRLTDGGFGVLLVPPEPAGMFVEAGWSKADISATLYQAATRNMAWVKQNGWKDGGRGPRGGNVNPGDEAKRMGIAGSPEEIHVVICGGPAGNFPTYIQTYAANFTAESRKIRLKT